MPDYAVQSNTFAIRRSPHPEQIIYRVLIYTALITVAFMFIIPFLIMLNTSVKTLADIRSGTLVSLPVELTFSAWGRAWETLHRYFLNSVSMVVPAVFLSTVIGSINGYVFAKWRFKGSDVLFIMLLFGCFIPFQVILLPMSRTLGAMGLAQSVQGLVFVHVVYGIPFTTLFFRNYYVTVPDELMNSAKLDGAGFLRIFLQILLPISGPIFVVAVIWQTTQIWNDFLFGVSFSGSASQPITVALNNLVNTSTGVKEYNVDMAGAIIAGLPTLLIYVISGKYFIRGLTAGSLAN